MKKSFLRTLLKKETLLDKLFKAIDDYEIYSSLIGLEPELGETISSPIRAVDDFPSFALFIPTRVKTNRPDEIWFKDLADGRYGDVITFTKCFAMHHFGVELSNSYEVIKFLDSQLDLGLFDNKEEKRIAQIRDYSYAKRDKSIFIKSRGFTNRDLEYWGNLCLTETDLNFFNVKSVRYLLQEDGEIRREFRTSEMVYAYIIHDKIKLYQPNAPKAFKFRNSCPGNDPYYYQGFQQLQGHDTLIITKSLKDVMVFWKFFNKILNIPVDVIAPHAESINLSNEFIIAIKEKYKRIIVVSDFDLAGVKFANKLKKLDLEIKFVSTKRIKIDNKLKVLDKDISDFLTNNGELKTKKLLKSWNIN